MRITLLLSCDPYSAYQDIIGFSHKDFINIDKLVKAQKEACFDLSEKQQMRECVFSRSNQLLKCVDLPAEEPQVVCFKVFQTSGNIVAHVIQFSMRCSDPDIFQIEINVSAAGHKWVY